MLDDIASLSYESQEEVEPEGVVYLRRLRTLIATIAAIDQENPNWSGPTPDAAAAYRRGIYQPLAMAALWPITESLVDHIDEAGKVEMENLRTILVTTVQLLGKHLNPEGSRGSSQARNIDEEMQGTLEPTPEDEYEHLPARARAVLEKLAVRFKVLWQRVRECELLNDAWFVQCSETASNSQKPSGSAY